MNDFKIPPEITYEDKQIEINGIKFNYWDVGTGPETLFFIHGVTERNGYMV
ncbi:MAG: hypothetical protein ACTSRG_22495 [Candidatus Helarchaeota archaeon]